MQMIRSGDNRKTQLLSQLDQKIFFSVGQTGVATCSIHAISPRQPQLDLIILLLLILLLLLLSSY